jgi:hypothetical protein
MSIKNRTAGTTKDLVMKRPPANFGFEKIDPGERSRLKQRIIHLTIPRQTRKKQSNISPAILFRPLPHQQNELVISQGIAYDLISPAAATSKLTLLSQPSPRPECGRGKNNQAQVISLEESDTLLRGWFSYEKRRER